MPRMRYQAFTLIELLVVISIIALLLSILLPAMSRVRRQAKGTVCLAHLRELSHGWHLYADDFNDVCLPGRFYNQPGGTANPANWYDVGNGLKYRPRWVAAMGKYVGIHAFAQPSTTDDRQDYDSQVYHCPATAGWVDERNYAYGYNFQFLGNARRKNGKFVSFPVPRSRLRNFAGTVLGADALGTAAGFPQKDRKAYANNGTDFASNGNHGWSLDPPRLTPQSDRGSGDVGSPRSAVDPRHSGRVNAVFTDGHGESQTPHALGYRIRPDGHYADADTDPDQPTNRWFSGTGRDEDPPTVP